MARLRRDPFDGSPYRGVARVGRGRIAVTYYVVRRSDGRALVVKLLRRAFAKDAQSVDRMRLEWEALRDLSHPHLVSVIDFGVTRDGRPFVVFERLAGTTVEQEWTRRTISIHEAATWTRELVSGLGAAHRIKVVHRDVHLGNLFLERPDVERTGAGRPRLKVLDFGFAKVLEGARIRAVVPATDQALSVGASRFMSPEAARGGALDERSDLYAAGLVLWALLSGHVPYPELAESTEVQLAQATRALPLPSTLRPGVPAELDAVVARALEKSPSRRFASASDFMHALRRVRLPERWAYTELFDRQ
jgi:serine/threonine-protein kinase